MFCKVKGKAQAQLVAELVSWGRQPCSCVFASWKTQSKQQPLTLHVAHTLLLSCVSSVKLLHLVR